ncbi:structural protein P5 [Alistipes communis]
MPRGLRNRNPGNIRRSAVRYKGETKSDDAAFKAFASTAWGYRAMFVLLHTVVRRSGVDPDAEIDTRDGPTMTRIAAAMARVENGVEPNEAEIAEGWRLFSADF